MKGLYIEGKTEEEVANKFKQNFFLLVKFVKNEYLEDLLNGSLYMNNADFFHKHGGKGIKDEYDSAIKLKDGVITDYSSGKPVKCLIEEGAVYSEYKYFPMFCTYMLDERNFVDSNYIDGKVYFTYALNEKNKKHIVETFRSEDYTAVIFRDTECFQRKVQDKLDEMGISYTMREITYLDIDNQVHLSFKHAPFAKSKEFSYEQEYRIFVEEKHEQPYILEIGDIRGFVTCCNVDTFANCGYTIIYNYKIEE